MKRNIKFLLLNIAILILLGALTGCGSSEKKMIRVKDDVYSGHAILNRVIDGEESYLTDEYCNMMVEKFNEKTIKIGDTFTMEELCGDIDSKSFKQTIRQVFAKVCAAKQDYKAALDDPIVAEQEAEMRISYTDDKFHIFYTGYKYYEEGGYGINN